LSARVTPSRQTVHRGRGKCALVVEKRRIARPAPDAQPIIQQVPARLQDVGSIATEVARFRMQGKDRFPLEWLAGSA
jgi:hypothetical protein